MIPTIGLMIGFYIIAKMVDILLDKESAIITKVLSVFAIGMSVLGIADFFTRGMPK